MTTRRLLWLFGVIVAASAAAPGFVGMQAQRHYESLVARLESAGYRLEDQSYARGWFGSEAHLRLAVPAPSAAGQGEYLPRLTLRSHIAHGPFLGGDRLPFGLARVVTEIGLDDRLLYAASPEPPVQVLFGFGGAGEVLLQVPAQQTQVRDGRVSADLAGVTGQLRFASSGAEAQGFVAVPALRLRTADGGLAELRGARLDVAMEPGPSGLPTGGWRMEIESLGASGGSGAAAPLSVERLEVQARSREQAGEVEMTASCRVGTALVDGERYGPLDVRLRVARLPAAALVKLGDVLAEVRRGAVPQAAAAKAVLPLVDELLASDPLLALERLELDTPFGRIEGEVEARAVGLHLADAARLGSVGLLSKLDGRASLRLPEGVLRAGLRQQALAHLRATAGAERKGADHESEADQLADQRLAALLAQGWAARDGDRIATIATWRNGLLTVNGKTIPLPATGAPATSRRR